MTPLTRGQGQYIIRSTLDESSGVASSISEGDIFIYSYSTQLISFEIDSISKEINCAEHEYMNMSPSLIELATPLDESNGNSSSSNEIAYFVNTAHENLRSPPPPPFPSIQLTLAILRLDEFDAHKVLTSFNPKYSGVASVDNWRGEYSSICVHRP